MFNHDDREMLRRTHAAGVQSLAKLDIILARLNDMTAELIQLRNGEDNIVSILKDIAKAEEQETRQLDFVRVTLTSP